jgi:hypothetical protein
MLIEINRTGDTDHSYSGRSRPLSWFGANPTVAGTHTARHDNSHHRRSQSRAMVKKMNEDEKQKVDTEGK